MERFGGVEEAATRCLYSATAEGAATMATAVFGPCPHCKLPLTYLEGVTGATNSPNCPRCKAAVAVPAATLLVADHSAPASVSRRKRGAR
jgi:hypothetical protein